jgi:hypothetical protein
MRDFPLETNVTSFTITSPGNYRRRQGDDAPVITFTLSHNYKIYVGTSRSWATLKISEKEQ